MSDGWRFDMACVTSPGGRAVNEDSVLAEVFPGGALALVADGLGGQGAGEQASALVCAAFRDLFLPTPNIDDERMGRLMEQVNDRVCALQAKTGVKMMSTLAALTCLNDSYLLTHVGDSRGYLFRGGELAFQTRDHSAPQLQVMAGALRLSQIRRHPDRNRVLRAVGGTPKQIKPELDRGSLQPGDAFLLVSDGFWEPVLEMEMAVELHKSATAREWLDHLTHRVGSRLNGESDNLSAVAVMCAKG